MDSENFRHILAPVDFSELSAHALRYAARLAKCADASVTALYADPFQPPPYFTEGGLEQLASQLRTARKEAEAYLGKFVAAEAPELQRVKLVVREALPADAILRAASEEHADLIVMGTHGRSGLNRLAMGSVTERVMREAATPVLAVRGDWQDREIRRIVCPVNNSEPARRALAAATGLAKCLGATVTVLHVQEPGARDSITDLCAWLPGEQRNVCSVTELSGGGDVAQEVISLAVESKADLLVLGARHRTFADTTVVGANTIRMLRHAPCPVMAVFGPAERA
jgi:nucleotide-binding universal stress UspA family protein